MCHKHGSSQQLVLLDDVIKKMKVIDVNNEGSMNRVHYVNVMPTNRIHLPTK
jgi:hypothetical protein